MILPDQVLSYELSMAFIDCVILSMNLKILSKIESLEITNIIIAWDS